MSRKVSLHPSDLVLELARTTQRMWQKFFDSLGHNPHLPDITQYDVTD